MFIVTTFSALERLLGFIYRIFLSRTLGSEGMGIYQIALSVVGLIMTLTASGIPITVSRIMTKNTAENKEEKNYQTVSAGIFLSAIISLPVLLALMLIPNLNRLLFQDERSYNVFSVILPGVALTSIYSVLRGFFWGKKQFFTYSLVEFLEELVMLIAGVILINLSTTTAQKTLASGYAVLISYVFSFVLAIAIYF